MPLTQLVCPHCEATVEVPVTSVTRTRQCPACSKSIALQFATKVNASKRRAVLIHARALEPEEPQPTVEFSSALEGNVRMRMLHDPEVKSNAVLLSWGIVVVVLALGLLLTGHFLHWWPWLNGNGAEEAALGQKDYNIFRGWHCRDQLALVLSYLPSRS